MTIPHDVPSSKFIDRLAKYLRENVDEVQPLPWAAFAKTGVHKEMPPEDPDWWFIRVAAVLRRVYVDGPIGVERMRSFYGGNKNRGSRPNAFRKGSGSVLRKAVQQLEAAGLIVHDKVGRKVSPAGMAFLDAFAHEVKKNPPAPVPKRVKPVVEEAKKADGKKDGKKKGGDKAAAADGADGAKAEKKPAKKKADKAEAPQ